MKYLAHRFVKSRAAAALAVFSLMMAAALARSASQPIYDEQADARRDIATAIARASKTGRNVVLIFGANW
ncbi:MAG TPA: hypothetical protein VFQ24_05250 [Terriglobia bacterium]|nr:hypothetical protein [Terriglobia bacterium]